MKLAPHFSFDDEDEEFDEGDCVNTPTNMYPMFNNQVPSINIIILCPQANAFLNSNYGCIQPTVCPIPPSNQYFSNCAPNQNPNMMQQPQFFPQFNYNYPLSLISPPIAPKKESKKEHLKNKKKKDKKKSKEKKSKQEKKDNKSSSKKAQNYKEISFQGSTLEGIFNYFRTQSNIYDEIRITTSGESNNVDFILNIQNKSSTYWSPFSPNQWICFEFRKHKIVPSNYTIKSYSYGDGGCHLKSWVLEGSNDQNIWTNIDEQKNCSILNAAFGVHTFSIGKKSNLEKDGYKYIRIRQTSRNWHNDDRLVLTSMEFYGKII